MAYPFDDENEDLMSMADDTLAADQFGQQAAQNEADGDALVQEFEAMQEPSQNKMAALMSEYQKLQQDRQNSLQNLGILDSVSQMAQAFAGKGYTKPTSNMDMFEKIANRPVQDYEQRTKQSELDLKLKDLQKERDPKAAAQAREIAKQRYGALITPDMSRKDIQEMQKIGDPMKNKADTQGITLGEQKVVSGKLDASDETAKRDINSPITAAYQQAALKVGLPKEQVKNATAHDLEQLLKLYKETKDREAAESLIPAKVQNADGTISYYQFGNRGTLKNTGLLAGYAPKTDLDPRTGEKNWVAPGLLKQMGPAHSTATAQSDEQANLLIPEVTMQQLPKEKQDRVVTLREQFLTDTKDERASLQAAKSITGLLDAGEALDGDILRAVQTKFAKAGGEKGAMTENDVAPYGGRQAILDRLKRNVTTWATGKMTDSDREFLRSLAGTMQRQSENELKRSTDYFSNNLYKDLKADPNVKAKNIKQGSAEQLLGADVYTNTSPAEKAAELPQKMVDVVSKKSGKKMKMPADKAKIAKEKDLIE